ncbi:hypothetical protein BS17DRAFT_791967 [Gyrodon lividus]|nr:hypothetical protein BS17DRAFT_791967 [Gyrodon lividus]
MCPGLSTNITRSLIALLASMGWLSHSIPYYPQALDLPSTIAHCMGALEHSWVMGASKVSAGSVRQGKFRTSAAGYPHVTSAPGSLRRASTGTKGCAEEEDKENATKMPENHRIPVAEADPVKKHQRSWVVMQSALKGSRFQKITHWHVISSHWKEAH